MEIFLKDITVYLTRMYIPLKFWMYQGSEYATDYEFVWFPNKPGFIIWWKNVSVGASSINFWNDISFVTWYSF